MVTDPDVTLTVTELRRLASDSGLEEHVRESALVAMSSFPETASIGFSLVSRDELVTIYRSRAARHPEWIELQELTRRLAQASSEYVHLGTHEETHVFVTGDTVELLGLVAKRN